MQKTIHINPITQKLHVMDEGRISKTYPVSTAKKGLGEQKNSNKTPRGWHTVRAKIGEGSPINTVFVGRRSTGEIYSPALGLMHPDRDWILSRILWLSGLEPGFNRLGNVDSMQRYIYIHGCPDEVTLERPLSIGCVRMGNQDVIELFESIDAGTRVFIGEDFQEES